MTNAGSVKTLRAIGLLGGSGGAGVDLFVGLYQIQGCDQSVGTDGALSDVGFSGPLKVKAVYSVPNASNVAAPCRAALLQARFLRASSPSVPYRPVPDCK